jgi:iron complex outermembrane receptor protein
MGNTGSYKLYLRLSAASALIFALGLHTAPAMAQDSEADASGLDDVLQEDVEEVVVTGSRLRRSTYNSASPVQVISGALAREVGLFNTAEILQSTPQASGLQINNSFTSFVLDNGLGASTIGFRGLGADRTLVLVNGRRLAPAGVGGAPSAPDANLIPSALIDRIDNVFDGASAVYGSDAVAGVSNVILRSDIDGLEVGARGSTTETGGGEEYSVYGLYGKTGDNWSFTVATEYSKRQELTFADSKFFNACDEYRFEDENGNLLTQYRGLAPGTTDSACRLATSNRVFIADGIFGNVWATPGTSNIGIPNFSETIIGPNLAPFAPAGTITQIDSNGDGVLDQEWLIDPDQNGLSEVDIQSNFYNFDRSARAQLGQIIAGEELVTAYGVGNYNFEDDNNTEIYFEGLYSRRENTFFGPGSQFFPTVPSTNPYNITNTAGLGVNSLNFFGVDFGAFDVTPIINVVGDRDNNDITVGQYRLIGGVRGNIGFMDSVLGGDWTYDAYVSHSRSDGTDTQTGINGDRVTLSLETTIEDPNNLGTYICGADSDGDGIPDGTDGCVVMNPFANSLFQEGGGTFSTQAETDYFFSVRSFDTEIEQTIVNGAVQGALFEMPNGSTVPILLGYEFRRDTIRSVPNDIAANGSLFAFFTDRGATGTRDLHEVFAETSIEILKDQKFAEALTLDLSGRLTDESAFEPHFTYSAKLLYRPISWLTLRGTYGTSYRAPNLRERFLEGATGFNVITDPCVVPDVAREATDISVPNAPEVYLASQDDRDANVISACQAAGLDPTTLGLEDGSDNSFRNQYSAEILTGGVDSLNPETSTSFTWGFVVEQPFTDVFELKLSFSYFDIDIRNSISEPSFVFVIDQCFDNTNDANATSGFCNNITRDSNGQISLLDTSFVNFGQETAKGIDWNLYYEQDFEIGSENLNVILDVNAVNMRERFFDILGTTDDNVGEPAVPKWRANANLILGYNDFRLNWFTRWIQGGELDEPGEFDPDGVPCDGLPVGCRPIYYTTNYDVHNASVSYLWNDYVFNIGVENVFNTAPPIADGAGVFSLRNVPLGIGYNLTGRTFFASIQASF